MKIGSIGYATSQGLGHLMRDFHRAGVITDPIIYRHSHPSRVTHPEWYPRGTPVVEPRRSLVDDPAVDDVLKRVDVLLAWETFFDWTLIDRCRKRGILTVLCPMYEWFPRSPPAVPDLFACPSKLDMEYFCNWTRGVPLGVGGWWRDERGWKSSFLPIPVRTDLWRQRTRATCFVHNAGNVGHREHKGTREVLRAIPYIKTPLTLTIRAQDGPTFGRLLESIPFAERSGGAATVRFDVGERPYESLWTGHDVLVQPEKFNGLSLPLQEARAAGMLVMTSDRFPHNDWLPKGPLVPVAGYHRAAIGSSYLEFDEAEVRPEDVAATMDAWFERDISAYSEGGRQWAEENSWPVLGPKWREAIA